MGVLEEQERLYAENKEASRALNAFPAVKGALGLTSEQTKSNPEYQALKRRYDQSFRALQEFNTRNAEAIKRARKGGRDADCELELEEDELELDPDDASAMDGRRLTFDRRMETIDGHLVVTDCNISKANVCPYRGSEIPDPDGTLNLDPTKIYMLYRDAAELEAAVKTYERVPLMSQHIAVNADDPQKYFIVGTVSNVRFVYPYLKADLTIWDREGIEAVESGRQRELSCGYHYVADKTPGTSPDGVPYDIRMTQIVCNHVALVEAGRAGPDVLVADAKLTLHKAKQ